MHCKHEKCQCHGEHVQQDGYCSDTCRQGKTSSNGACECGHPDCR